MAFYPFEIESSWREVLKEELEKPYVAELAAFVEKERAIYKEIFPPKELVFNSLQQTPYSKVKVVIVGQDPYHGPGQAHGLSFSVSKGVTVPPSLKNIYKEIESDLGISPPDHGCLVSWSQQGVLLLNALLTVRRAEPLSHQGKGWETLTDAILEALSRREDPVVFLLWGRSAQEKCLRIPSLQEPTHHVILKTTHPSPFSAHNGFLGCKHFSQANISLEKRGKTPIDWKIS